MNTWLLPDTHLNHLMLQKRGFRPDGFSELILRNLHKMVGFGDRVIHMGDVAMGNDSLAHGQLMKALANARSKTLILGNHDKRSDSWYYGHGWDLVVKELWIEKWGYDIVFSHEPYKLRNCVAWKELRNLHGHTHGNGHHSVDVGGYYDSRFHIELALEHSEYKPFLLSQKLFLGKEKKDG